MKTRRILVTALLGIAAAALMAADSPPALKASYLGECLPELIADHGTWVNAPRGVKLRELEGGPVLVLFTVLW